MLHSPFPSIAQNLTNVRLSTKLYGSCKCISNEIHLSKNDHKNRVITDISKNDHMNKYKINPEITTDYIQKRLDALFSHTISI